MRLSFFLLVDRLIAIPRRMGLKTDQAVVDKEIATLDKKLEAYDAILAKQKYLAGDVRAGYLDLGC